MTCPKPEVLSQWADGSLAPSSAVAVSRHAEECTACRRRAEDLRAVGSWIVSAAQPGRACLSAEEMAAVLEGGRAPGHVRTCPRCASEFRALRSTERKGTRRREKPAAPLRAWVAAAAIFMAVGILLVLANRETAPTESLAVRVPGKTPSPGAAPEVAPTPPLTISPAPASAEPSAPPKTGVRVDSPAPPPPIAAPSDTPSPSPKVETPKPEPPRPAAPDSTTTTRVEPAKAPVPLSIRSGGLASMADGRWVKATRIEEGMALRAEGRTQIDFAQTRLTLDGASRFTVSKEEFSLAEGAVSGEVSPGSKFALVLEEQRIIPMAASARVMFCARPDRVVAEEGSLRWKEATLHEGVEHSVKKDRVEAQSRRTLPAAARTRETLTWRLNLNNENAVRKNLVGGRVEKDSPDTRVLVSEPLRDGGPFYAHVSYTNGGEAQPVFTVKPTTAIRFQYYLNQPAHLELVMWSGTKAENFNKVLDSVAKQWTTVTVFARDVPANRGGKNVTCEVGDKFTSIGWFAGTAGQSPDLYIDRLEVLEIDR